MQYRETLPWSSLDLNSAAMVIRTIIEKQVRFSNFYTDGSMQQLIDATALIQKEWLYNYSKIILVICTAMSGGRFPKEAEKKHVYS